LNPRADYPKHECGNELEQGVDAASVNRVLAVSVQLFFFRRQFQFLAGADWVAAGE